MLCAELAYLAPVSARFVKGKPSIRRIFHSVNFVEDSVNAGTREGEREKEYPGVLLGVISLSLLQA